MEAVDPSKQARFCNSFCAATQDIAEGLSASRSAAADGHWMKWDEFCQEIDLDPYSSCTGIRCLSSTPL